MRITFCLLFISICLLGCAVTANTKRQDDGSFLIMVHSSAFGSIKKIEQKFDRKARKACDGDFEYKKILPSELKEIKTYDSYNTTAHVLTQQRVVVCKRNKLSAAG